MLRAAGLREAWQAFAAARTRTAEAGVGAAGAEARERARAVALEAWRGQGLVAGVAELEAAVGTLAPLSEAALAVLGDGGGAGRCGSGLGTAPEETSGATLADEGRRASPWSTCSMPPGGG